MNKYIEKVLKDVQAKNADQKEFLQAVDEVLTTLEPVIKANKKYEEITYIVSCHNNFGQGVDG